MLTSSKNLTGGECGEGARRERQRGEWREVTEEKVCEV